MVSHFIAAACRLTGEACFISCIIHGSPYAACKYRKKTQPISRYMQRFCTYVLFIFACYFFTVLQQYTSGDLTHKPSGYIQAFHLSLPEPPTICRTTLNPLC